MPTNNNWNNAVSAANVSFTGGTMSIGTDATTNVVNISTGAASRNTSIGNISGTTSLELKCGTGDFSLASATGTIISAIDTGEVTLPLQSAFYSSMSANVANVTGDNTTYTIIGNTVSFDRNSDYSAVTGIFTAPVTGLYLLINFASAYDYSAAHTGNLLSIPTSNRLYYGYRTKAYGLSSLGQYVLKDCAFADMDAGDTAYATIRVSGSTKTVGCASLSGLSGFLVC